MDVTNTQLQNRMEANLRKERSRLRILKRAVCVSTRAVESSERRLLNIMDDLTAATTKLQQEGLKPGGAWDAGEGLKLVTLEEQAKQLEELKAAGRVVTCDGDQDDADCVDEDEKLAYARFQDLPVSLQKSARDAWYAKRALKYDQGACSLPKRYAAYFTASDIKQWEDRAAMIEHIEEQERQSWEESEKRRRARQTADADKVPSKMRRR